MILVTGGLGYLGGRIADHLLRTQNESIVLGTRMSIPTVPSELEKCQVIQMDLMDDASLENACKGVTSIIHLAAINAHTCANNPEQALLINGLGTLKILRAAVKAGVERFFYFSTAHVYGTPLIGKIDENTLPRPMHHYSISHRIAEDYVLEANVKGSIEGVVFRLSNAVGAPLSKDANCWMLVANDLVRQAVVDSKMHIRSDRAQERDFVPISDVCGAIGYMLQVSSELCRGEIFNIGSNRSLTLKELANMIADRMGTNSKTNILFDHLRENPVARKNTTLQYSVDKLKKLGVSFEYDILGEIDGLIKACNRWFVYGGQAFNE